MKAHELLACAQRLQALAQAGLTYATNAYDAERYEEIRTISAKLLQLVSDEPFEKIVRVFAFDEGYQTPKVDVRAVIFREGREILLVKEKIDGDRWSLPGGWADIGFTPSEVAVKEVKEESGLDVKAVRVLAVLDKREHAHPPQPGYVYKIFIECEALGGTLASSTNETSGSGWFALEDVPTLDLSTDRVTAAQLSAMFALAKNRTLPAMFD